MTHEDKVFYTSLGICPHCGKNTIIGEEKYCTECKAKNAEQKMKKYESDSEYREKFIQTVVDGKRERKQRRREQGLCIECGKRPPKKGIATCEYCRAKANQKKREKYQVSTTRQQWIENGLCFLCGSECEKGYKVCEKHHMMYISNAQTEKAIEHRKKMNANWF